MTGPPVVQRSECFSRYFLASKGSFISCKSPGIKEEPFLRVLGRVGELEFALSGSLSVLLDDLFLFDAVGGILWGCFEANSDSRGEWSEGCKVFLQ